MRLKNYNKVTAEEGERIKIAPPDWTNQSCESQIELDLLSKLFNLIKISWLLIQIFEIMIKTMFINIEASNLRWIDLRIYNKVD